MNKIAFQWKTILKGICVLLSLSATLRAAIPQDGPDTFQHDAYWASYDSAARTATEKSAVPPVTVPTSGPVGTMVDPIYEEVVPPSQGLFLHNLNQSQAAMAGSRFLGPGSFFMDGYVSQGLTYGNTDGEYYSPTGMNDKEGYQLSQVYVSFGRKVQKGDQFSIGGQIDLMYGTDYYYMSSAGLENRSDNSPHWNATGDDILYRAGRSEYGAALPQCFGEVYMPFLNGLDLKVGHFYSVMGYESLQSNQNFFYSRSYSRIYGMPTSMTGAVGTLGLINGWSLVAGGVNEWNAFDSENDNFSGVLGLNYESQDHFFTFSVTGMYGKQSAPCYQAASIGEESDVFILNTFAKFQFTHRLSYVCEFTAGYDDREYFCLETFDTNHGRAWFGLTNYLFYKVCDQFTLGTRFEWFNDADNTVIDGGYGFSMIDGSANYFALTFGGNWTPVNWISVRPEIRYDFSDFEDGDLQTYDTWSSDSQLTVGADVIVRF